jgi:hypothetical protein
MGITAEYGSFSLISTLISKNNMSGLEMIMNAFKRVSKKAFDFTRACVGGEIKLPSGQHSDPEKEETPMEFAARNRNYEAVEILLKHGAPKRTPSVDNLERIFKLDRGEPNTKGPPYRDLDIRTGRIRGINFPNVSIFTKKRMRSRENKIRALLKYKLR